MNKVAMLGDRLLLFICPGCGYGHNVPVVGDGAWFWNRSLQNPTLSPSVLIAPPAKRCHSFIEDGKIRFLEDCEHVYAGEVLDLPNIDDY